MQAPPDIHGAASIRHLGRTCVDAVARLGAFAIFGAVAARGMIQRPIRVHRLVEEVYLIGVLSLIIVLVSGIAVGMVLGLQGYNTLVRFGAEQSLGAVVALSLLRELGPVLAALLVAGRAGSATAAEIGSMVVTEQLDGLRMMSIDPMRMIVSPKIGATILSLPILTTLFTLAGMGGAYLVGVKLMGVDHGIFLSSITSAVVFRDDVALSLLKSVVFGVAIGWIATHHGFTAERSAAGVSRATTSTVVVSSVTILLVDYVVTALWGI